MCLVKPSKRSFPRLKFFSIIITLLVTAFLSEWQRICLWQGSFYNSTVPFVAGIISCTATMDWSHGQSWIQWNGRFLFQWKLRQFLESKGFSDLKFKKVMYGSVGLNTYFLCIIQRYGCCFDWHNFFCN